MILMSLEGSSGYELWIILDDLLNLIKYCILELIYKKQIG
jgi:hypothetical protein